MIHRHEVKPMPKRCKRCIKRIIMGKDRPCHTCEFYYERYMHVKDIDADFKPLPLDAYESVYKLALCMYNEIEYYGEEVGEEERRKVWYAWKVGELLSACTMSKGYKLHPTKSILEYLDKIIPREEETTCQE